MCNVNISDEGIYYWSVSEAKVPYNRGNSLEQKMLEFIKGMMDNYKDTKNVDLNFAVTLYAKTNEAAETGKFAYDLLFYYNLKDPSQMFGPLISDDARTNVFSGDNNMARSAVVINSQRTPGSFADREAIECSSYHRIGPIERLQEDICGLLCISYRNNSVCINNTLAITTGQIEKFVKIEEFVIGLEKVVRNVRDKRIEKFNESIRLLNESIRLLEGLSTPLNNLLRGAMDVQKIAPMNISNFMDAILRKYIEIIDKDEENIAFTVFAYNPKKKRLEWFWSNGPSGVAADINIEEIAGQDKPFITKVARDNFHRPLLIHKDVSLHGNKVLYTKLQDNVSSKLQDNVSSNIIVPILSTCIDASRNRKLLGIIDVQQKGTDPFDTDAIQLLYRINSTYLSEWFEIYLEERRYFPILQELKYNNENDTIIHKKPLDNEIHKILSINYNPMKYLLYWKEINDLITSINNKNSENKKDIPFPVLLEIWPSMSCEHNCVWCRTRSDRMDHHTNKYISSEGLIAIANDISTTKELSILISGGGEPLNNPFINKFIEKLNNYQGNLGIFTNGKVPQDFLFWKHFFSNKDRHSFIRVSFNASTPCEYYKVHFNYKANTSSTNHLPDEYDIYYLRAKKTVFDLLAFRHPKCTVAIGTTIHSEWKNTIPAQVKHAEELGVDFIQIRPELMESGRNPEIGRRMKREICEQEAIYNAKSNFAVKYTDSERNYEDHDYDKCYAMYLVPALVPDIEQGWIKVLPCSYTQTLTGQVPALGRIREGKTLSDFWTNLSNKQNGGSASSDGIEIMTSNQINPKEVACPQCRYHMLNKRINYIADTTGGNTVIGHLVDYLSIPSNNYTVCNALKEDIKTTFGDAATHVINIEEAQNVFKIKEELGYRPSL